MTIEISHLDYELQQLIRKFERSPDQAGLLDRLCYELNIRSYHDLCIAYATEGLKRNPHADKVWYELIIASSLNKSNALEGFLKRLTAIQEERPDDLEVKKNLAAVHFFLENDDTCEFLLGRIYKSNGPRQCTSQTYEVQAQLDHSRQDLEACILSCDKAIDAPGPSARVVRLKGLCYMEMGELQKALNCFRFALEQEPNFVWACHSMAAISFERGEFDQAFQYYGRATYINPRDPGNYFLLSEAFMEMEKYDLARAELSKMLLFEHDNMIRSEAHNGLGYTWLRSGDHGKARLHLIKALELNPNLAEAYYNMGCLALERNQLHLAERNFKNALNKDPLNIESLLELGFVCLHQKKFTAARRYWEQTIEIDPLETSAYIGLSQLYMKNKQHAEQLSFAQKAYELTPEDPDVCNHLGIAYECCEMDEHAEEAYVEALELDPLHSKAANNLGYLYERLAKKSPEQADDYLQSAIAAWKKRWQICYLKRKSVKGATAHLEALGVSKEEIKALAHKNYPEGTPD